MNTITRLGTTISQLPSSQVKKETAAEKNESPFSDVNPADEYKNEVKPLQVGPPTPGGPVSAIIYKYYDPIKEEFIKPMPFYDKDSYNCHSTGWNDSMGDPNDTRNFPQWKRWDNYPDNNIAEKGYVERQAGEKCQIGDRAIYWTDRNDNGKMDVDDINHSAIVIGVDSDGKPILMASKWGEDATYVHGLHQVPDIYGTNIKFYGKAKIDDGIKTAASEMPELFGTDVEKLINLPVEDKSELFQEQLSNLIAKGKPVTIDNEHPEKYISTLGQLHDFMKKQNIA
jgi:hypothetical protein